MSAIGDYIHLTSQGYFFGLVPKELSESFSEQGAKEQRSINTPEIFQRHQKMIKDMVKARGTDVEAKKIQEAIDSFISLLFSPQQSDKQFFQKIIDLTAKEIKAELDSVCLNVKPQKGSMDEDIAKLKEIAKRMYDSETGMPNQQYLNESTVYNFIMKLRKLFVEIGTGRLNIKHIKQLEEKKQEILELARWAHKMIKLVNEKTGKRLYLQDVKNIQIHNARGTGITTTYDKDMFMIKDPDTKAEISIIDFAQVLQEDLLDHLSWNSAGKKGKAGELVLAAISAYSKGAAQTSAEKVFKEGKDKMRVGQKGGSVVYLKENFISGFTTQDDYYKKVSIGKKAGLQAKGTSPDKVDVIFYYDKSNSANISVKNYSDYIAKTKGFSGVSGAPFLSLIQWFEPVFVNHWINATIQHADLYSKDFQEPGKKPLNIYDAHKLMLGSLVVLGAIGGTQRLYNGELRGQDQPDYLVWNNNTTTGNAPEITVYAMSTLLENCLDTITIYNSSKWVKGYDYFLSKEWSTIKFYNDTKGKDPSKGMEIRILNILTKLHQIKISTHFFLSDSLPAMFK